MAWSSSGPSAERGPLRNYQLRQRLPALFAMAADLAPERLMALAPRGEVADEYFDGPLLAVLIDRIDAARLRDAFATVPTEFVGRSQVHWHAGLALPWCGLALRSGDLDAALEALAVDDPQLDNRDAFPAIALAASVPPLALWKDPSLAADFADRVVTRIEAASAGSAALAFRVGALLAHRLDAAGRAAEATALRERLRAFGALATAYAEWLAT